MVAKTCTLEIACDQYRELSDEGKNKKIEYRRNCYCNVSEEYNQKLKECRIEYRKNQSKK